MNSFDWVVTVIIVVVIVIKWGASLLFTPDSMR